MLQLVSYWCLLVEAKSNDVVQCYSDCPVTLPSVRVGFRIVRRQNQPTRTGQVPATWCYGTGGVIASVNVPFSYCTFK